MRADDLAADPLYVAAERLFDHPNLAVHAIGVWLANGGRGDLARYLARAAHDGRAEISMAVERRNGLLRVLAASLGPMSAAAKARIISRELLRYRAAGWRHERDMMVNPHPAGSTRAILWSALHERDAEISYRQIRKVLSPKIGEERD
jgi:hypothetical protein